MVQDSLTTSQVSIVIPCFNAAPWVARAVASAQAQGDVVDEIIVVDDGSTDISLDVLRPFSETGEITLLSGPNRGGCHARNQGLAAASSPYVVFLDADDEFEGPLLQGARDAAEVSSADIVISPMEVRFLDGRASDFLGPFGPPKETEKEIFAHWRTGRWVNPSAILWRTAFLRDIGAWDESTIVDQDGEVLLRGLLENGRVARNENGRGIYHRGIDGSVSLAGGVTREKLAGHIESVRKTCEAGRAKGWERFLDGHYAALYTFARRAFKAGHTELGRHALGVLHDFGHKSHHGTRAHVLMAGVLGLERKVQWFERSRHLSVSP